MVADNHYRWDFIGLSTDTKPTPETSEKVVDGSTFYCSDTSKLYVYCTDNWYEKTSQGGGGGTSYTAGEGIDIADNTISVDTDTIQAKLTAGENITIADNVISAAGGGGGAIELTSADYDYPDANPTGVALWRKDAGMYYWKQGVNVYINNNEQHSYEESAVVFKTEAYYLDILTIYPGGDKRTYTWYKVVASTGAGASIDTRTYNDILSTANIAQTTGNSTENVMSQNATTSMVYRDPSTMQQVQIGHYAYAGGSNAIAIGGYSLSAYSSQAVGQSSIAIGIGSKANNKFSVSFGGTTTAQGEMNIEVYGSTNGYNDTQYRLLTGLYDGQSAHDAATVGQINATIDAINTALSTNIPHIGA